MKNVLGSIVVVAVVCALLSRSNAVHRAALPAHTGGSTGFELSPLNHSYPGNSLTGFSVRVPAPVITYFQTGNGFTGNTGFQQEINTHNGSSSEPNGLPNNPVNFFRRPLDGPLLHIVIRVLRI